jgi:ankyrin repeat protein
MQHNASLETYNHNCITPFHAACRRGRLEIVQILFRKGVNVYFADKCGISPFAAACREGHLQVVQFLGQTNLDIDRIDITAAIMTGTAERRQRLLRYMDDLRLSDSYQLKDKYEALKTLMGTRPIHSSEISDMPLVK